VTTESFKTIDEAVQDCDKKLDLYLDALKKDALK
jgi:hypothetical protein